MKVTVDKSAWKKLKKEFEKAQSNELQVGWFPENRYGSDNSNLPMAYVAMLNEFGHVNGADSLVPGAETPPRPFMRVGFRDALKSGKNDDSFKRLITAVANGQDTFKALYKEGDSFRQTLRQVMLDWDEPGNAALTIEMKGFDDPLRDTSELIANVSAKVAKKGND